MLLIGMVCVSGCETVRFYSQAVIGQAQLLSKRESIQKLIDAESTEPALREKLLLINEAVDFAASQLELPSDGSYQHYVDIGRPYVAWNVFAAEEFSIEPKKWCYPIAGCVSYRGYFKEQNARDYAIKLQAKGFETFVGGVPAYSTLGWLNDPVLSNVLKRDENHLVATLFHELSHQKLYVKGDTTFSESFSRAVELEGLRRWLRAKGDEADFRAYTARSQRQKQFIARLLALREQLGAMYTEDVPIDTKRRQKQQIIELFISDAESLLKSIWQDQWKNKQQGFEQWLDKGINNARLAVIADYHVWVPGFLLLLNQSNGDLAVFYERCREIAAMDLEARKDYMQRLTLQASHQEAPL